MFPEEGDARSVKITVKFEKGGAKHSYDEDALWSERSRRVPFSDDPISTYEVEIRPGDRFLIRDRPYEFAGVNRFDHQRVLFRRLYESDASGLKQLSRADFTNAFGASDGIYFDCKRVKPPAQERAVGLCGRIGDRIDAALARTASAVGWP